MALRTYRKKAGLTQAQLATLAGVSQSQITHHERGRRSNISLLQARAIVHSIRTRGVACGLDDVFPPDSVDSAA